MEYENSERERRNYPENEPINSSTDEPEDTKILQQTDFPAIESIQTPFDFADKFQVLDVTTDHFQEVKRHAICRGAENGLRAALRIRSFFNEIPRGETVFINFSSVSATADFVEPIVQQFFYPADKKQSVFRGKLVFLNPDPPTLIAIARSTEAIKANCLALQTLEGFELPWTFLLVGHLEAHLRQLLSYIRNNPGATTQEMVANELGRSLGNVGGRVAELLEMGLVYRKDMELPSVERTRAVSKYRYFPYHPFQSAFPLTPNHFLDYAYFEIPHYAPFDLP